MKYFLYLCNVRTDFEIDQNRGGESPSETHYGFENKCHFGHTLNLIGSDNFRTMQESFKQRETQIQRRRY